MKKDGSDLKPMWQRLELRHYGEWMIPGIGQFDGTVEGAMKAGLEAYPP